MARKPLSSRLGKVICYVVLASMLLPLLLSATAPPVSASGEWILIENFENIEDWTGDAVRDNQYAENGWAGYFSKATSNKYFRKNDPINLADITSLRFWAKVTESGYTNSGAGFQIATDDAFTEPITLWWRSTAAGTGSFTGTVTIDVSAYTNNYYIRFESLKGLGYCPDFWFDTLEGFYDKVPQIISIISSQSVVDRKLDYSGSGAVLTTTITIRVQDNDGYGEISSVRISIRDKNDAVIVDNVLVTDNIENNSTTLDFAYSFDCPDNLPNDDLGAFDVNVVVDDIWGVSDTNDWGGDGASLFTVDDLATTINFNPAQPYVGYDLTVSGTVSRVVGTASTDNVRLIDANHGTFALGAEDSWDKTYTISAADFGENVAVTIRITDSPLDGENQSSYLVNDNMIYQIEVRWENDYSLAPEPIEDQNWAIKFNWEGGTQSKTLENNPENIIVASRGEIPFLVELNDNDNYWRRRVPQAGGGVLTFVLPTENSTINQYAMTITDYTAQFDAPDGWVSTRIYIDNALAVINDDWWDATNYAYAYLVLHEWYEVYLFGAGGVQRHIGHIQAESDLTLDPFVVSALEFGEDKIFRWEAIEFESSRGDDGEVVVGFRDAHDNTDNVILEIYTLDNEWRYQAEFAYPSEFESSWTGADNDNSYKIKLEIASREFGSWDEWMTVGPIIAPLPLPTPEAGGGLGATIPIAGLAGIFLVAIVAMSFSERHASTGTLAIAFTAIFLKFLSVKVGANLMPVPSSVLVLLLFLAIMWKAGEKL